MTQRIGQQNKGDIKVAVDLIIFTVSDDSLKVILIQMKKIPFTGKWAFPGGLIGDDESIDNAAKRELKEKTGVADVYLEHLYTFGDVERDPYGRVVSVSYFALIPSENINLKTIDKYFDIGWFDITNLPELAYDHKKIAAYALKRLQWKVEYANVVYSLLPRYFSLTEMQKVYEVILGRKLDRRNFHRKVKSLGIIKPANKKQIGKHRPAQLYEFSSRKPRIIAVL